MKERYATKIEITSDWVKGDKICHVHSEKEIVQEPNSRKRVAIPVATFQFSGYNPFPCYSMHSTYGIVAKWMCNNGWKETGNRSTKIYYETIDTETGKLLLRETEMVREKAVTFNVNE